MRQEVRRGARRALRRRQPMQSAAAALSRAFCCVLLLTGAAAPTAAAAAATRLRQESMSQRLLAEARLSAAAVLAAAPQPRRLREAPAGSIATAAAASASKAPASGRSGGKTASDDVHMLRIAHVNDIHNRIEETGTTSAACSEEQAKAGACLGGWPRVVAAVRAARREAAAAGAGFLFLDAGDEFDGTLWDVVFKGMATPPLQNLAGVDAMTLGNHEFSFQPPDLARYIGALRAPMLGGCNVDAADEPALRGLIKRWEVKRVGQYKIAILGWLTPDTPVIQLNTGKVKFAPVAPAVARCLEDLRREHPDVDYVIGLSHTGYQADLEAAKALPGLDLIIGAHTHTYLAPPDAPPAVFTAAARAAPAADCLARGACDRAEGPFPTWRAARQCQAIGAGAGAGNSSSSSGSQQQQQQQQCVTKEVPVVQAYYASKYMGLLEIDLRSRRLVRARPLLLGGNASSSPVAPDPEALAMVRAMAGPLAALRSKVAGATPAALVGGAPARRAETNFGSLMADLLVAAARRPKRFEAAHGAVEIGLFQGGGIRVTLPAGNVTYGDALAAMPFGNTLAVKAATGAQIKQALANGVSRIAESAGRFPQVSGLRLWHHGAALLGVKRLLPDGKMEDLEDGRSYLIASTSYQLSGGDGYSAFAAAPFLEPSGETMDALLTQALEAARPAPIKVPDPEKERRIVDCAAAYVDCANAALFGPCCGKAAATASGGGSGSGGAKAAGGASG